MSDASARARPDWQPAVTPTAPTASMLAYAFGERIAPPAGRVGAKLVPCSGRMVDGDELAVTMLHFALWDLRRRELVTLVSEAGAAAEPWPVVQPELRASADQEFPGSLEQRLFRSARSGREDRNVVELVAHLYPADAADPFSVVFDLQNEAMLEARLMRRDVEGRVSPGPGLTPTANQLIWLCENVASHLVGFAKVQAEWDRDRAREAESFAAVHAAIRAGIASRQERRSEAD